MHLVSVLIEHIHPIKCEMPLEKKFMKICVEKDKGLVLGLKICAEHAFIDDNQDFFSY